MFDCIKNLFLSFDPFYKVKKENGLIILTPKDERIPLAATLIFLHGLGDSGEGYIQTFQNVQRPVPDSTKIILPTAPLTPVSIAGGQEMNSWFDFQGFNEEDDINKEDVIKSSKYISSIIENEVKNYEGNYKKIYVGGFSQGACIALNVGLNFKEKLGGIIALSGLLFPFCINNNALSKKDLPIFIAHGTEDEVINFSLAKYSYKVLQDNSFTNIKFNFYEYMGHFVNPASLPAIKDFIFLNNIKDIV